MPECKLRLKAVRACSTDQRGYLGGFIPKYTELSQSVIFPEERLHTFSPLYAINPSEKLSKVGCK